MKIKDLLSWGERKLKEAKIDSAPYEAEFLLCFVLKQNLSWLLTHLDTSLPNKNQIKKFKKLILSRKKQKPLAYLVKSQPFYRLNFYVDEKVMIPRPETELLVEEVINLINSHRKVKNIVDIGTGSGCIAITLKKYFPQINIFASDLTEKILKVARKNAEKHKTKIIFKKGNLLMPFKRQLFDIIVANLPYLSEKEYRNSPFYPEIAYEPKKALVGGEKGDEIIKKLIIQSPLFLTKKGFVFLEISPQICFSLTQIAKKVYPKSKIIIKNDLANLKRIMIIKTTSP